MVREGLPDVEAVVVVGARRSLRGIVMAMEDEDSVAVGVQAVVAWWFLCCGAILKFGGGTG